MILFIHLCYANNYVYLLNIHMIKKNIKIRNYIFVEIKSIIITATPVPVFLIFNYIKYL